MSLCWIVMVFTHTRGLPRGELHTSARPSWKRPSTPGGILCPPLLSRPHQEAAAAGQQSDAAWELEISEQREHQMASCPPGRTGTRRCQLENSTWSKSCSLWGWIRPTADAQSHRNLCYHRLFFTHTHWICGNWLYSIVFLEILVYYYYILILLSGMWHSKERGLISPL